jgi:hypothetical protein
MAEDYIDHFEDMNPDDLDKECISIVKDYYQYAKLTSHAYIEQLKAKEQVKKVSANVFLEAKDAGKATDNKCKELVASNARVEETKNDYFSKLKIWEDFKNKKEAIILKKDMIKQMSFNRRTEQDVEQNF